MRIEDEQSSSGIQERIQHRQANRAYQASRNDQGNSESSALRNNPRDANPSPPSDYRVGTSSRERGNYNNISIPSAPRMDGNPNPPKKSKYAFNAIPK